MLWERAGPRQKVRFNYNIYTNLHSEFCLAVHLAHVSRSLATAAESSSSVPLSEGITEATVAALRPSYKQFIKTRSDATVVQTGIIVNRSPILTRTPTPFERAYYAYHRRIERALHNPIPKEFYFKPGSLLEGIFDREENARERKAWGRPGAKPKKSPDSVEEESESGLLPGEEPPPQVMSRNSEADRQGDIKSLNRKGERNLYLLVQAKDEAGKDAWRFPQTVVNKEELLHEVNYPLFACTENCSMRFAGCSSGAAVAIWSWHGHLDCQQKTSRPVSSFCNPAGVCEVTLQLI